MANNGQTILNKDDIKIIMGYSNNANVTDSGSTTTSSLNATPGGTIYIEEKDIPTPQVANQYGYLTTNYQDVDKIIITNSEGEEIEFVPIIQPDGSIRSLDGRYKVEKDTLLQLIPEEYETLTSTSTNQPSLTQNAEETNSTQEEVQTEPTIENSQPIEAGTSNEGKTLYKKEGDNTLYYRNDSGDYIPYTNETNESNIATYTIGTYGEDSLSSTGKATTLWQIAVATGLTVDQLVEMNKDEYPSLAENPNLVKTGWVIKVDKSQVSTDNKPPEEPNTGGSTVSSPTIKIDFENIETTITTLSSLYNNITELIDSYTGEISGLNSSTVWQGEDKESLIEVANGEYLSYLSATKDNLQNLISQLEGKRNQFRDAETALSKLTI